jgi:hypothetical protein
MAAYWTFAYAVAATNPSAKWDDIGRIPSDLDDRFK